MNLCKEFRSQNTGFRNCGETFIVRSSIKDLTEHPVQFGVPVRVCFEASFIR